MIADPQSPESTLPIPDKFALKLSESLQEKIRLAIKENGGSINFERYMQMALYEPGLGYYSAGSSKFGEQGDFVTAPEISPLFSRCLAKQCQQVLSEISSSCILELGPGTGVMAIDILRELERNNSLPEIYYMLEPSADLRQRQQLNIESTIPHLKGLFVWVDRLPEEKMKGVILANEVIDAMPVKRIVFDREIKEYVVACDSESKDQAKFQWIKKDIDQQSIVDVQAILSMLREVLPMPYITEINFYIKP